MSKNRKQISMPREVVESMLLYSVVAFWKVGKKFRRWCDAKDSADRGRKSITHVRNLLSEFHPLFMQVGKSLKY
jgi:hypothetical protein